MSMIWLRYPAISRLTEVRWVRWCFITSYHVLCEKCVFIQHRLCEFLVQESAVLPRPALDIKREDYVYSLVLCQTLKHQQRKNQQYSDIYMHLTLAAKPYYWLFIILLYRYFSLTTCNLTVYTSLYFKFNIGNMYVCWIMHFAFVQSIPDKVNKLFSDFNSTFYNVFVQFCE